MPLQNRVTPLGELIADPARGLVYGNRGCLHDDEGRVRRRFDGKRWIACRLRFRGWHREPLMQPGRFTELFFLDEATAFAAGHRPCALCRREDYRRFVAAWSEVHGPPTGVDAIDDRLHEERVDPVSRDHRIHEASIDDLPDAAFVLLDVLREIREIRRRCAGLGVLDAEAEELERRVAAVPGAGTGTTTLTTAEVRILAYLPTHLSFREIGERLFISRNTVKTHALSIYRKLGASSRSDAVRRAQEVGLLEG